MIPALRCALFAIWKTLTKKYHYDFSFGCGYIKKRNLCTMVLPNNLFKKKNQYHMCQKLFNLLFIYKTQFKIITPIAFVIFRWSRNVVPRIVIFDFFFLIYLLKPFCHLRHIIVNYTQLSHKFSKWKLKN